MRINRIAAVMILVFIFLQFPVSVSAAEPSFSFDLRVDGKTYETAQIGDILTVSLYLERTDSSDPYMMYAMQAEIAYDDCFRLVPGSEIMNQGVTSRDIASTDGSREFYMNYLSIDGGTSWNSRILVGSFQLEVVRAGGTGYIANRDYLISTQDGTGNYPSASNHVTVEVIPDVLIEYTVKFNTQGGNKIPDQIVLAGDKIERPINPIKHGYSFVGWYRDSACIEQWDFNLDTVHQNMTLYAKWTEIQPDMIPNTSDSFNLVWYAMLLLSMMMLWTLGLEKQNWSHSNQ